jgi:hypothetical protein
MLLRIAPNALPLALAFAAAACSSTGEGADTPPDAGRNATTTPNGTTDDDGATAMLDDADGAGDVRATMDASAADHDATPDSAPLDGSNSDGDASVALAAIPLATPNGSFYSAQLKVGDQQFALIVDTGSGTMAVAGDGCRACASAGVSPLYTPSATATDLRKTTSAMYGDGSRWTGEIFDDTAGLAHGTPDVALAFASIASESQLFNDVSVQGILGMGPPQLLEPGTTSYFGKVTTAGVSPVLSLELCGTSGTMWLGGYDDKAVVAAPRFTPFAVASNRTRAFYAIDIDDVKIGGTSLGFGAADFQSPVVDSGTTLFYLPTPVFAKMASAIGASAGFQSLFSGKQSALQNGGCISARGTTPAMVDAALPKMTVSFPDAAPGALAASFDLEATQSYLYFRGNGTYCAAFGDAGPAGAILGDTFLGSFVTVIDVENHRVGFALDQGCSEPRSGLRVVERPPLDLHPRHPRLPAP